MGEPNLIHSAIATIYDAALSPSSWPSALEQTRGFEAERIGGTHGKIDALLVPYSDESGGRMLSAMLPRRVE